MADEPISGSPEPTVDDAEVTDAGGGATGADVVEDVDDPDASDLRRFKPLLETVGLVLAPVSVIAGLLVYFGTVRTRVEADFLGVDPEVFAYSSQDHVIRSVAPLLGPLAIAAALVALAVHLNTLVGDNAGHVARSAAWGTVALWATRIGFTAIVVGAFWQWQLGSNHSYVAPTLLGGGAILVAGGSGVLSMREEKTRRPQEWTSPAQALNAGAKITLTFVIVFAAFGFAARLAQSEGFERIKEAVSELDRAPEVTVLSTDVLALNHRGVACLPVKDSIYTRRYSGLHLVAHREGRYLLVPSGFDAANAITIILDESPSVRVEIDASPSLRPVDPGATAIPDVQPNVRC